MIQLIDESICNRICSLILNPVLLDGCYGKTQRQKFCALVHSSIAVLFPDYIDRLPLPH